MARARLGRNFNRQWLSAAISTLGDGMVITALPLLAVTLTDDPLLVAGVAFMYRLPWLLLALVSGALVDRMDRRNVMLATDLVQFAIFGVLGVLVAVDTSPLAVVYLIAFILGVTETFFENAVQSILPSVVPRESLEAANSRLFAVVIMGREFVGPPLGSALFAVAAALPFLLNSGSFLISAAILVTMTGTFRPPRREVATSLQAEIAEGLRWLWRHRLLRTLSLMLAVVNLVGSAAAAILVLFALEEIGLTAGSFGLILTAGAVGSILATVVVSRVKRRFGAASALCGSLLGLGVAYLAVAAFPVVAVVLPMYALRSFSAMHWGVISVSLRQRIVPTELLGRVNSAYRVIGWSTTPVGALAGGLVASGFGLRAPFLCGGLLMVLLVPVAALTLSRERISVAEAAAA